MSQFYILSSDALKTLQIESSHTISKDEADFLVKGKDIIKKYFQMKIDGIRSQLGAGKFQWNEHPMYITIQALEQCARDLDEMETQIEKFAELAKKHKK